MISTSTLLSLLSSTINTTTLPSLTPTLSTAAAATTNLNKLLQIEAIKLIQISLDKLTSTKCCVYKENLYKNLFISKILNKSKLYYYQSIVNTLRFTLISKLTYLLNTNKNFKYLISTPSVTSSEINEDDYINLIIKEAIDNLVNNNINIETNEEELASELANKKRQFEESDIINETTTTTTTNKPKRLKLNDCNGKENNNNNDECHNNSFYNLNVEVTV
jgi:hypothetical protein